jgi:hypothetical protein
LKGRLDDEASSTLQLGGGGSTVTLHVGLRLDGAIDGFIEEGELEPLLFSAPLSPPGSPFGKKRQRFTAKLVPTGAGPAFGESWATISVTASGAATVQGCLADATRFSASAQSRTDKRIFFHTPLYGPERGFLAGEFDLEESNAGIPLLGWFRPSKVYLGADEAFFLQTSEAHRYEPPRAPELPIPLSAGRQVNLSFSRDDFPKETTFSGVVDPTGRVRFDDGEHSVTFRYQRGPGTFSGTMRFLSGSVSSRFTGVFLQSSSSGVGVFGTGLDSGWVLLEPIAKKQARSR